MRGEQHGSLDEPAMPIRWALWSQFYPPHLWLYLHPQHAACWVGLLEQLFDTMIGNTIIKTVASAYHDNKRRNRPTLPTLEDLPI